MLVFWKIWHALYSRYLRFEIVFFCLISNDFIFYTVDPYSVCKQEHTDQIKVLFGRFLISLGQ